MAKNDWKNKGSCIGYDVNLFFEKYEDNEQLRPSVEKVCASCPVARTCFAVGISQKETGVWGGIYLEKGKISREFGKHRTKDNWAQTWQYLTNDR
jgi:hypothetical protein